MHSKTLLGLALAAALAAPARAQDRAGHGHDRDSTDWGSIFADFFMGPEKKETFRWQGKIAPGSTLEIKGVNGRVVALPASGTEVEIEALKHGRRKDPATVEIKVLEHAAGITVCALYPSLDPARPNECQPGRAGRMNVRNNDVSVDFAVKVPAGVAFVGRTVNGRIEAERLAGDVEAYTVNGSVHLAAAGHAHAETVNGSIEASIGRADWTEAVAFKTVNGSVSLTLPADASTALRVETVNGSIENEFPLNQPSRLTRREVSGTIGSGGRELSVKTVNGSVHLRKAS